GLRQAETLSSQGFKELFEGYGNFNNTRNGAEIETLKEVNITKGANSIKSGSGSLGGSVIYKTKDARDYLLNKDYYVSYKKGYATENNQSFNTLTLAGRYKKFDALVVTTSRNGHELENYDYKNADSLTQGKKREKADPYKIEQDSTLLKLSFNPTENHRFTLAADLYEHRSRGQDLSYTLKYLKTLDLPEDDSRHTNDKTKRRNISFSYENFSQTPFWDTLKITFSKQKIKTRARTDEYCDAGVRDCEGTANPAGLKLTKGKITRRDGSELQFEKKEGTSDEIYDFDKFIDTGNKVITGKLGLRRASETWYDCSIFDCTNPEKMKVFEGERSYGTTGTWKKIEKTEVETRVLNGRNFARIKNDSYGKIKSILPSSPGYLERLWQERDLDTNTQQLNLDLTKDFKTWRVEHNLQYGSSYNTTMKRMVNRAGYDATDVQWWAKRTLGTRFDFWKNKDIVETCGDTSSWNAFLCPRVDPEFSYLLPIKTKEKSVYLFDNVVITDYLSFDLGYRYDNIHYQPKYKHGITPKLPDDIVKGLFIPLDPNSKTEEDVKKNVQQNIDYIAKQNKKYKAHSYSFASTIDPTSFLRLQLKYSKGFRAPTSDEMYFTFKHPDFTILPNTNLKPEIAKTKEIAFTLHNDDWGFISTSLFKTNYRDFIDLVHQGKRKFKVGKPGSEGEIDFDTFQNINRDSAVVKGIEINSKVFLGKMAKFMDGFNLSYKYTYQKGRMDGNIPMNAIQPKTMVYGLGYDHPSQKFGFNFYTTHVATKNPEDTYDIYAKDKKQMDTSIKWRSKSYTILDLIGYVQPIKNLTIRAGVYNLTNRKYITWDSARSIRSFGTSNVIDQKTGLGINRF
ncbi:TPA: TonB-dependent hemoglobin/transferrin/lactoferrin family receptor, partial [Haemophilus influenzae]